MPGELQQHDLKPGVARAVVAAAGIEAGDTVVEVGPGLGALTGALLATGATVLAVETDPARCAALKSKFSTESHAGRLGLLTGDIRHLKLELEHGWRVVANPPFQLTAWLFRHWLLDELSGGPPRSIDLVLQREAGSKFGGQPEAETRSSILARLFGAPRLIARLNRDDVSPPSRVDLCHWQLRRGHETVEPPELARIDRLLDRAFAGVHTMREALRGVATGEMIRRQAAHNGWDPEAHPRTLSPNAWRELAEILVRTGKLR